MIESYHFLPQSPKARQAAQGIGFLVLGLLLVHLSLKGDLFLVLMAILAGIGAIFLVLKPHFGVLALLSHAFLQIDSPLLDNLKAPYLLGALLLIPLALSVLRDRQIWVWRVPQVKIFLAIGILFLVSTWWSGLKHRVIEFPELDFTESMIRVFVMQLVLLIFFVYFIRTRQRIELAVCLMVGLILSVAVSAMVSFLTGDDLKRATADFSVAQNANRLAHVCVFAISLIWFYRSHAPTRRWKALTLLLLLFLPPTVLASGSRSGFLQMLLLTALILREQKHWSPAKRVRSVLLVGLFALFLAAIAPSFLVERVLSYSTTTADAADKSLRNRIRRVEALVSMVASDPIFGIGIGNFSWMNMARNGFLGTPHNSYLWAITEGGIGVFGLYLALFYVTYRMLRQLERAGPRELLWLSKGLRVNLIMFLIFTAFANFWLSNILYWIVGLTVTMTSLWQRQGQNFALASEPLPAK